MRQPRRLTLRSRGRATAVRFRPSFHSGPSQRRLREPLMSNVRRHKESLVQVRAKVAAACNPAQHAVHERLRQLEAGIRHLEERVSPARLANNNPSARAEARARTNVGQSMGPQPTQKTTLTAAREASVALPRGLRLELGMQSFRAPTATPNPSFERTRSGRLLQAFISFSALRSPPPRASQLKR